MKPTIVLPALTIENIPEPLYARLKAHAAANHRSLNGELIHCLEQVRLPQQKPLDEQLARIRELRKGIKAIKPEQAQAMIDKCRE